MSNYYIAGFPCSAELYHHGIQGQKWGQRRYQNDDGSLTPLGRIHYGYGKARDVAKVAARAVGKGTVATLKTTGKVIKNVAKYGTYPIRKNHAKWLTKKEMAKLMERYDLESEFKRKKLAARGESMSKKILDASGKLLYNSLDNLAKETAKSAGAKVTERLFEGSDKREARNIQNEIERRRAEEGYRNQSNKEREGRLQREANRRDIERQEHENRMANQQHRDDVRDWRREEKEDRRRRAQARRNNP